MTLSLSSRARFSSASTVARVISPISVRRLMVAKGASGAIASDRLTQSARAASIMSGVTVACHAGCHDWLALSSMRRSKKAGRSMIDALPVPPRNATSSSVSAASRRSMRLPPSRSIGCLTNANKATGSPGLNTVSTMRRISVAVSISRKWRPPESSASMPKRASSPTTRRARFLSAVTNAAVLFSSLIASRSARATASASSRSLAVSIRSIF